MYGAEDGDSKNASYSKDGGYEDDDSEDNDSGGRDLIYVTMK